MYDIERIKEEVKQVIGYSQNIDTFDGIDDLIDRWETAKSDFIAFMNDELIYEYPETVTFGLGEREKQIRVDEFLEDVAYRWHNNDLYNFISNNRDGFFNNQVIQDYETKQHEIIHKGMKLVKAFKFFEKDPIALEDIQNSASRIIQEDKISGTLCISVHPLDFLSASENTHNWRSCHALDGEYRAGNLSYMVDESTVICYLKSGRNEKLPNFPEDLRWNSKKWRVWLHFSEFRDMMFAGRQYPFPTDIGIDFVKDNLLPKAGYPARWSAWSDEYLTSYNFKKLPRTVGLDDRYLVVGNSLKGLRTVVKEGQQSMNFNDILHSSCYVAKYSYRQPDPIFSWSLSQYEATGKRDTSFTLGGPVKCIRCGKNNIAVSETMNCIFCEEEHGTLLSDDFGYCSCCNRHFFLDDAVWVNDEPVCSDCAETELETCDKCGCLEYKDRMTFNRDKEQYLCTYCANGGGSWL